jgi:hypothetical protein
LPQSLLKTGEKVFEATHLKRIIDVQAFFSICDNPGIAENGEMFADGGTVEGKPLRNFANAALPFHKFFHDFQPYGMCQGFENLYLSGEKNLIHGFHLISWQIYHISTVPSIPFFRRLSLIVGRS